MIRRILKTAIAALVHGTRSEHLVGRDRSRLPFIVTYHRVVEDDVFARQSTSHPAMLMTVRTLERHLEWLGRRFDLVSLDEVADRVEGTQRGRRPVAAVTFDDGYQDVCDHALPLLKRKGIPAAMFVVSDRAGTDELLMHDRLFLIVSRLFADGTDGARRFARALGQAGADSTCVARALSVGARPGIAAGTILAELDQATVSRVAEILDPEDAWKTSGPGEHVLAGWDALRSAAGDGFTIGSHGCTHALLANEDPRIVVHEVLGSKLEIERRLDAPVRHIAYPAGSFDPVAVRIVAAAGYRCGFTICQHRDPQFPELTIPRHVFWENTCRSVAGDFSAALMSCHVHDVLGFRASCPGHRRASRSAPSPSLDIAASAATRPEPRVHP